MFKQKRPVFIYVEGSGRLCRIGRHGPELFLGGSERTCGVVSVYLRLAADKSVA
jgi:hypothetical protein